MFGYLIVFRSSGKIGIIFFFFFFFFCVCVQLSFSRTGFFCALLIHQILISSFAVITCKLWKQFFLMGIISFAVKCSHLVAQPESCGRKYRNGDVSEAGFIKGSSGGWTAETPTFVHLCKSRYWMILLLSEAVKNKQPWKIITWGWSWAACFCSET